MDNAKKIAQGIKKYLEGSKQLQLLPMVIRELQSQTKIETLVVESSVELLETEKQEIEQLLAAKFGQARDINYITNPKLLGGIKVIVGGMELDLSVLGELERNYEN
jgi:F0F1-type ATP synthase delta subunit